MRIIGRQSAPAKVNLALDILGRRSDGYHEMRMVMQTVSLCDLVTLEEAERGFSLTAQGIDLPPDRVTMEQRAAEAFFAVISEAAEGAERWKQPDRDSGMRPEPQSEGRAGQTVPPGLRACLEKRIPAYAGLGGGSADAAALLRLLRERYAPKMPPAVLEQIGLTVGSDVPFCIRGGTVLAEGRGEALTDLPPLPPCWFVICKPEFDLPTAPMFARLRLDGMETHPDAGEMVKALAAGDLKGIAAAMGNVFETALTGAERQEIEALKESLRRGGALNAVMSGSGSAVFGLFAEEAQARRTWETLRERHIQSFLAEPAPALLPVRE